MRLSHSLRGKSLAGLAPVSRHSSEALLSKCPLYQHSSAAEQRSNQISVHRSAVTQPLQAEGAPAAGMALAGNTLPVLAPQAFASGALVRRVADTKTEDFLSQALPSAAFLPVSGRNVWLRQPTQPNGNGSNGASPSQLLWLTADEVQQLLGLRHEGAVFQQQDGSVASSPVLLGRETSKVIRFALPLPAALLQRGAEKHGWRDENMRSLLSQLTTEDLSVAGHAVALSAWHEMNLFCGRCGSPTQSIEAGAKRRCLTDSRHRLYPRTDPVAIMMVESPDGTHALLGRSHGHRPGMLTCLSGFVDQSESIEEAVRREVLEEAGIPVGPVAIVGSQPWPIGRGGSCELMIGCIAQASSADLRVDFSEMEDVRWVSRETVARAVEASASGKHMANYTDAVEELPEAGFWLPPPYAIAHSLIKEWVSRRHSWFSSRL